MSIKIKANEKLFNEWQAFYREIGEMAIYARGLSSIVQNDMETDKQTLLEWKKDVARLRDGLDEKITDLHEIYKKTIDYVLKGK
jgi:hypothetical protein